MAKKDSARMVSQCDSTTSRTAAQGDGDSGDAQHSPLPWHTGGTAGDLTGIWVEDADGYEAPYRVARGVNHADAEFIVRACNSHYELLETLNQCARLLSQAEMPEHMPGRARRDWQERTDKALGRAIAAIAKAEGR